MYFRTLHRQLFAGIVLLTLLLQTVLPAIVSAATPASERWVEVCAASGVKWVKLDAGHADQQHAASDHCVLCAAAGPVPEFDVRRYVPAEIGDPHLAQSSAGFIPSFPGHATHSRGPPTLS